MANINDLMNEDDDLTQSERKNLIFAEIGKLQESLTKKYANPSPKPKPKDGLNGKDGKDGRDGKDGKDGKNGQNGLQGPRGFPGKDGIDGQDGVSVTDAYIDFDGSLIIDLSTGRSINVGEVVSQDLEERIKIVTSGGAGTTLSGNQVISVTDNSNAALRITQLGTGNALLVEDETNPDASPFVITATGNSIQGHTSSITGAGGVAAINQVVGTTQAGSRQGFVYSSTSTAASTNEMAKSASATVGTHAIVASGETLGTVRFSGSDGTNFFRAAEIGGYVDGTPGTNDMPGRLEFSTTADGASSPTERMRIDSSGNVGIGTSSPTQPLVVSKSQNASTWVNVANTTSGTGAAAGLLMTGDASTQASIELDSSTHSSFANALRIRQIGAFPIVFSTTDTERMRIDSSGNLLLGTTTGSDRLTVRGTSASFSSPSGSCTVSINGQNAASANAILNLVCPGSNSGSITYIRSTSLVQVQNGGSGGVTLASGGTAWVAVSDERQKENLVPITDAITKVSSLRSVTGNYIADEKKKSRAFLIAQDVQAVLPEAIDNSDPEVMGLAYTDVIPLLVAAIKEQQATIVSLQETLTALTTRITALESI